MAIFQLNGKKLGISGKIMTSPLVVINVGETYTIPTTTTTVDFKYIGDTGTTATIVLSGVSFVIYSNSGVSNTELIWDFGGENYNFGSGSSNTIFRTVNGTIFKLTFNRGSLYLNVGNVGTPTLKLQLNTIVSSQTVTIPHLSGYTYNYVIDYGDGSALGTVTSYNDTDCTHIYAVASGYTVSISGTCPTLYYNNGTQKLTITKVLQWGNVGLREISFYGCTNLNYIPGDSTGGLSNLINFYYVFRDCTSLTSLPQNLLQYANSVTSFRNAFRNCRMTSIPSGFFDNCPLMTDCTSLFYNCILLTTVPIGLFSNNLNMTFIDGMFYTCTSLTSLPNNLFKNHTSITSCVYMARGCTSLQTIGDNVFSGCSSITTVMGMFYDCTALRTIGDNLYQGCSSVLDYSYVFWNNIKLSLNTTMFYNPGEESTVFLNKSINWYACFYRTSFSGTQGTAPNIWTCTIGTGTPVITCFGGAGNSSTSLSNYASIPGGWIA